MTETHDADRPPNARATSIATLSKDRIGQAWSYPVNAGCIGRALSATPQAMLLALSFRRPSQLALKGIGETFAALINCGTFHRREGEAAFQLVYDHLDDEIALFQDVRVLPERHR